MTTKTPKKAAAAAPKAATIQHFTKADGSHLVTTTPKVEAESAPVRSALYHLHHAQALPMLPDGAAWQEPEFEPTTCDRFVDTDGTVMQVVAFDGALHKTPA